jgi:Flp pilus assembly protein TadD
MKIIAAFFSILLIIPNAMAAGSSSISPSASEDIEFYNEGVGLMLNKQFEKAENQFRKALKVNEDFAEAHNNLAYALRKQGPEHFDEALTHYNRAIKLKSSSPEPYMYRGVLHMQMGKQELAAKDLQALLDMGSPLAAELEYVIVNGREKEPEQFFGVSPKL